MTIIFTQTGPKLSFWVKIVVDFVNLSSFFLKAWDKLRDSSANRSKFEQMEWALLIRHVFKIYPLFFFRRPSWCYRRHHRRCLIMRTTPFLRQQLIGPMAFFPLLPRNYVRYNCFVCEIDLLMCMYAWKTTKNKRKALRKTCVSNPTHWKICVRR